MNTQQDQYPTRQYPTRLTLREPGLERRVSLLVDRDSHNNFVPGTGISLEDFQRYQARGRQLQARAMAGFFLSAARSVTRAFKKLLAGYRRSRVEASAIRQLRAMDERLLEDIGIRRDDIPAAVAGRMRRPPASRRPTAVTVVRAPKRRAAGSQEQTKAAA